MPKTSSESNSKGQETKLDGGMAVQLDQGESIDDNYVCIASATLLLSGDQTKKPLTEHNSKQQSGHKEQPIGMKKMKLIYSKSIGGSNGEQTLFALDMLAMMDGAAVREGSARRLACRPAC